MAMSHEAPDWYDEGRGQDARWLIIEWGAIDRAWEAKFSHAQTGPEKTRDGSWHVHAVIDLHRPLEEQPVYLREEP